MSLFKERSATSKKIVALENQIINLKQQLSSTKKAPQQDSKKIELLKQENLSLSKQLEESLASQDLLAEIQKLLEDTKSEVSELKSDLKKVRSENTRLKKKLAKLEESSDSDLIFEDS